MKIVKEYNKEKTYVFVHWNCCKFEAEESEFKWTTGQSNERVADVICPRCGKQFYDTPIEKR